MRNHLYIQIFLFLLCSRINAQNVYVANFSRNQYQSANQNWSVSTDADGYVYAANNEGLLTFDGTRWQLNKMPEQTTLRSVLCDTNGRIYVGAYEEFGYFERDVTGSLSYTSISGTMTDFKFHNEEIWKIVISAGVVYFQGFSSLFEYDGTKVKPVPLPGSVVFLLQADNRMFIQAINQGLFEFKNAQFTYIEGSKEVLKSDVRVLLPYPNGSFLIGTASDGMFVWNEKNFTPLPEATNTYFKQYQVNSGIRSGNRIIIGTILKGVFVLDAHGNILEHLHTGNLLQNNTILALSSTRDGNVWVGMDKGIDYLVFDLPLQIYRDNTDEIGVSYSAALHNKQLYLGTNQGVWRFNADADGHYTEHEFVTGTQGQVWMLKNIDETLFCGHNNGTFELKNNVFEPISNVTGGYNLQKVQQKNGSDVLLQSTYSNLVVFEKQQNTWRGRPIAGFVEPARYLEADFQNNIWVSHLLKGVYKINTDETFSKTNSVTFFGKKDGLPSDFNIGVFKVENRIVFTTGEKLFTWDDMNNKMVEYEKLNKQTGEFATCRRVVKANDTLYWFVKKDALGLFVIKNMEARLIFTLQPSLYNVYMVEYYENVVPLNDTLSLICLDNGFALFDLRYLKQAPPQSAKLRFTSIYVGNNNNQWRRLPIDNTKYMTLPWSENNIAFAVTDFDYVTQNKSFYYRLKGLKQEWTSWNGTDSIIYNRLPHGKYDFEIKTTLYNNINDNTIRYTFTVLPPWYVSWWAIGIYVLLFLGTVYFVRSRFIYRLHKQKEKMLLMAEEDKKRQEEKAQQDIMLLQYEKLEAELSHKSAQLANSTMTLISKTELLNNLRKEIESQKEELGSRYPKKQYERLMKLINQNMSSENDWKLFHAHFEQAHETFFKRLKADYPDLTPSDLKLCALLRLNLSTKEIAQLLNITIRGVEIHRYRLRKRLNLPPESNLIEVMIKY